MPLITYTLLLLFVSACGLIITLCFYAVTDHAWMSCFVISVIATILTLENSALLSETKQKDEEINILKSLHSDKLLDKVRQMDTELAYLKKERDKQTLIISNLKLLNKFSKSRSI